jgi:GNAT superfamily N-acetyltransferase
MYDIRPVDLTDDGLQAAERLFRAAFPHSPYLRVPYLDWQYRRNPEGPAIGFEAFAPSGALAAHYVCLPVTMTVEGSAQPALLSLNTATHPDHQRKGLFKQIAAATYDAGATRGRQLVVGVANANSVKGLIGSLGFSTLGTLEARLGLGLPWRGPEPAPVERTWSPSSLAWRISNPIAHYRLSTHHQSLVVEADSGRAGIEAILAILPGTPLPETLPKTNRRRRNPIRVYLGIDEALRWRGCLYASIPMKLRPVPLHMILLELGSVRVPRERAAWRFQALDFDPY